MRAISFEAFRGNCKYCECVYGHSPTRYLCGDKHFEAVRNGITNGIKYKYRECTEESCPVMQSCKRCIR